MSEYSFVTETRTATVTVTGADNHLTVVLDETPYAVEIVERRADGQMVLRVNGRLVRVAAVRDGGKWWVQVAGQPLHVLGVPEAKRGRKVSSGGDDVLTANMPSTVVAVLVAAGQRVEKGQPLVVLEAMKMETQIRAPHGGLVHHVLVSAGAVVNRGDTLVEVTPDGRAADT